MTAFIDTHAHVGHPAFDADREELLARVRAAGVKRLLCPAIGFGSNDRMMRLLAAHDEVSFAVGIHPRHALSHLGDAGRDQGLSRGARVSVRGLLRHYEERATALRILEERLSAIGDLAVSGLRVAAIGETGLDFSGNPGGFERDAQVAAFRAQVEMALSLELPLVLHVRDAHREAADVLHSYRERFKGVVHCFCQGPSEAKEFLAMGLCLGIGGKATYEKDAIMREALECVPLERIVLETDAPFVAPRDWPTRRNDPTALPVIAHHVARLLSVSVEELAEVTTETARRLFFDGA